MAPTTAEAEDLQATIRNYLVAIDRPGDLERIAQRIALAHSRGSRLVGFRRRGREAFLHEERRSDGRIALAIYDVGREGRLSRSGEVWTGRELETWLAEHRYVLEWIAPEWR